MNNFKLYHKSVELLNSNGYDILQIVFEECSLFYLVHSFQESVLSGPAPVDFNSVVGINITDFLDNMNAVQDRNIFMNNFNQRIEQGYVTRIQFSRNQSWIRWGAVK